ncbi:MAG: VCBS repeat-containing protein [Acidobacteria bacterium]|nr:VCBS repeat-containing protein [Acidobacteriota bacterium]MDA1236773.1 VCBS repeat-containing protein [Acidobacteriota bacterium]
MFLPAVLVAASDAAWTRHSIDSSSQGADGVRLADVNGDGLQDITTGWEEGGRVRVYLNPGPNKVKESWPAVTVGTVGSPEDAVFADLDADGAWDVVSSTEGEEQTLYVHWAPKNPKRYLDPKEWTTEAVPSSKGLTMWMFVLPMDIDGRNGVDLFAGSKTRDARIGWWQSPADPRKLADWKWHPLYDAGWIMSLIGHDMDGDGDQDLVSTDRKGSKSGIVWFENPTWREQRIGTVGEEEVMFMKMADLDGDGLKEAITAVKDGPIVWYRRTGKGWERFEIEMPPGTGTGKGVAVADFDLDGRLDIAFTCENAVGGRAGAMWLSWQNAVTDPVWAAHPISGPEGIKFDRIELLDLDGDGDLDLITCEERDNLGVIWYENPAR